MAENISGKIANIYVAKLNGYSLRPWIDSWRKRGHITPYTEYSIKETDFRIKTASFTSPVYFDLTTAPHCVLINSKYHENFAGQILECEYDENTGLYSYQCQDWSRKFISKFEFVGTAKLYTFLKYLIIQNAKKAKNTPYRKLSQSMKKALSGLKPVDRYNQSYYKGNLYKGNPFNTTKSLIMRDISYIEAIRSLVFNSLGYFDVYFSQNGILQIDPLSKTDWEKTGLRLTTNEYSNRKFKFSTTNTITGVVVNGQDYTLGSNFTSTQLLNLNLQAFFGHVGTSAQNPNNNTKAVSKKTTTKKTATKKKNNNGNPYNDKPKRILVSADGGSDGFKKGIIKLLKKDGWIVTDLGTSPRAHSESYNRLTKKYAVNLTIFNGTDPKTIDEPVTGWLKGRHEKYGVALVQMFDSSSWTSKKGTYNKKGMWYKRYGDFAGYKLPKAWDDNYSGASGGVLINDLGAWYKKYVKRVKYCCGPTPAQAYKQFKVGGYFEAKKQ